MEMSEFRRASRLCLVGGDFWGALARPSSIWADQRIHPLVGGTEC